MASEEGHSSSARPVSSGVSPPPRAGTVSPVRLRARAANDPRPPSGTASADFGGKKNVGIVVGVIDGFVYLGSSLEAKVLGSVLPKDEAAKSAHNWWTWPAVIVPAAVIGLALTTRVWNARPKVRAESAPTS